eukprot:gene2651-5029_t
MVRNVLQWLRDHGAPRNVSGSMHRLQLQLALKYMALGTCHTHDQPRKQEILELEGPVSLLSLLENNSPAVQEAALEVISNLLVGDADTKFKVLVGSRMGKAMADHLDVLTVPGVVRQGSRCLVNLWAEPPVPEVCPLTEVNEASSPLLEPGAWLLQEYSLRGESMELIRFTLSFDPISGRLHGCGDDKVGDEQEEFEVTGTLVMSTGIWTLQRRYLNSPWGVYNSQRASGLAQTFVVSSSRQPRVFRLFTDPNPELSCHLLHETIGAQDIFRTRGAEGGPGGQAEGGPGGPGGQTGRVGAQSSAQDMLRTRGADGGPGGQAERGPGGPGGQAARVGAQSSDGRPLEVGDIDLDFGTSPLGPGSCQAGSATAMQPSATPLEVGNVDLDFDTSPLGPGSCQAGSATAMQPSATPLEFGDVDLDFNTSPQSTFTSTERVAGSGTSASTERVPEINTSAITERVAGSSASNSTERVPEISTSAITGNIAGSSEASCFPQLLALTVIAREERVT